MTLYIDGVLLPEGAPLPGGANCLMGFASPEERASALDALLPAAAEAPVPDNRPVTRYESHTGFDYISLGVLNPKQPLVPPAWLEIFLTQHLLLFVGASLPQTLALQQLAAQQPAQATPPDRILYLFFAELMKGDSDILEDIEEEIAILEDSIVENQGKNPPPEGYVPLIGNLRKRLLAYKRYYESLRAMLEDLEENQNGFISSQQLRYFSFHTNRAERLSHAVLNLRDYVTQVRESYQNQLDINLNQTMKLFTVITAVFLPLTLITGWFGMNLVMPETKFPITYPLTILLCLGVAGGCLWYFKRHKWF